jgi:hypothetical protein
MDVRYGVESRQSGIEVLTTASRQFRTLAETALQAKECTGSLLDAREGRYSRHHDYAVDATAWDLSRPAIITHEIVAYYQPAQASPSSRRASYRGESDGASPHSPYCDMGGLASVDKNVSTIE